MPFGHRFASLVLFWGSLAPLGAWAGEDENWQRLRSLPREQRSALDEKLHAFDKLTRDEKTAVRAIDHKLSLLSAADQSRYFTALHRYHLWLQGLSDAQRKELNDAPADQRMTIVNRIRKEARLSPEQQATPLFLKVADFGSTSPLEVAYALKVWAELAPAQKAEVEKLPAGRERHRRLHELGKLMDVKPPIHLSEIEKDALIRKMEETPQLKRMFQAIPKKLESNKQAIVRRRLAANYYFVEHPPAKVELSNLLRFESSMPTWIRSSFDHLPPDEVRRRLSILYRLIYPAPAEITSPSKKAESPSQIPVENTGAPAEPTEPAAAEPAPAATTNP